VCQLTNAFTTRVISQRLTSRSFGLVGYGQSSRRPLIGSSRTLQINCRVPVNIRIWMTSNLESVSCCFGRLWLIAPPVNWAIRHGSPVHRHVRPVRETLILSRRYVSRLRARLPTRVSALAFIEEGTASKPPVSYCVARKDVHNNMRICTSALSSSRHPAITRGHHAPRLIMASLRRFVACRLRLGSGLRSRGTRQFGLLAKLCSPIPNSNSVASRLKPKADTHAS
jgi:hypothetical protein